LDLGGLSSSDSDSGDDKDVRSDSEVMPDICCLGWGALEVLDTIILVEGGAVSGSCGSRSGRSTSIVSSVARRGLGTAEMTFTEDPGELSSSIVRLLPGCKAVTIGDFWREEMTAAKEPGKSSASTIGFRGRSKDGRMGTGHPGGKTVLFITLANDTETDFLDTSDDI
jgi:hypothetical protein